MITVEGITVNVLWDNLDSIKRLCAVERGGRAHQGQGPDGEWVR